MNEIDLQRRLATHKLWLDSYKDGTDGSPVSRLIVEGERLTEILLKFSDFSGAKLSGSEFVNCRLDTCNFSNAEIMACKFQNCQFCGCQFISADLRGTVAHNCDFSGCNFTRADLTDAVLKECVLVNCIFDWSWLVRTDLRFANLDGVHLENARLLRTKLYNDKQYSFPRPAKITAQELDLSPDGDGSRLTEREGLEQLRLKSVQEGLLESHI